MKRSKQLKTAIIQATLITAALFGVMSCNNKQNEEDNTDVVQSDNELNLSNLSSDDKVQFKIRSAEITNKKNPANQAPQKATTETNDLNVMRSDVNTTPVLTKPIKSKKNEF